MNKKSFKTATEAFITLPGEITEKTKKSHPQSPPRIQRETESAPPGYEIRPERKAARLQLLIKPTIKAEIAAAAAESGESVNNLINKILETWINERGIK